MSAGVDFLGIGAARTGTTWLWNVLRKHPDIWMPPIKELNYFNRSPEYPSPRPFQEEKLFQRLFGNKEHNHTYRRLVLRCIRSTLSSPKERENLGWIWKYLFSTVDDQWYLSLFETNKNAIKGDITPAYSILSPNDVQHIHDLLPDLKVIYIIRNPVDRTWSHLKLRWTRGTLDINNLQEVIRTIRSPQHACHSNYLRNIENWSSFFPKEQFLICFYEEINTQPKQFITKILTFLQVNSDYPFPAEVLSKKYLASKSKPIPEEIKHVLAKIYYPEVKKLIPVVQGYSETWLKEIEASL